MDGGISSTNVPLGSQVFEFLGHEIVGGKRSTRRFTSASILGPIEAVLGSGGGVVFTSKAQADENLAYPARQMSWVVNDSDPVNNGVYQKLGASGTGSWVRIADLPYDNLLIAVTGGTANAITGQLSPQTPTAPQGKIYLMTPTAANTGPVTLAIPGFAGGAPVPVRSPLGSSLPADALLPGVQVVMAWMGGFFQLLIASPVDASGILADAIAARDAASGFADLASDSADAAAASAGVIGNQAYTFDTRAAAAAATIPALVTYIRTVEFAKDCGGSATYRRGAGRGSFTTNGGSVTWSIANKQLDARMFGAAGDGVVMYPTVTIASGSAALTAAGASFTAEDVGKRIVVQGAGSGGNQLSTTIASFTDATHITLGNNASTSITAASREVTYGTDDATALNAFLAAVPNASGVGALVGVLSGLHLFATALLLPNGNDFKIVGGGPSAQLRYVGTSRTIDLLTIGNGTDSVGRFELCDFRIDSAVTMTNGKALWLRKAYVYKLDGVILDQWAGAPYTLWDGVWCDQSSWGSIINTQMTSQNETVIANTGVELYLDNVQLVGIGSDTAIHIGGGFGGLYMGYVAIFGQSVGLRVDTSIDAAGNNQFFLSNNTAFDNNSVAAVYLADAVSSFKSFAFQAWASSATGGPGAFTIVDFKDGTISIGGGAQFLSNFASAIYYADASVYLKIGADTTWIANGGYGVNATIPTDKIFSDAKGEGSGNAAGDYSANCKVEMTSPTGGYRKYANGHIHQWGTVTGNVSADTTITFPIPFPHTVSSVNGNIQTGASSASVLESLTLGPISSTGFTGYARSLSGGTVTRSGAPWVWDAWGT